MTDRTMTDVYIDPKDYYKQEMETWESLWNDDATLYDNVVGIFEQAVLLPQKDLMLPILVSYALIPSKWARILPVLFSWGGKGSGKSTTAILAAKLHGFNQTFSAIRNALDCMRWIDPKDKEMEKEGALLPWDNIHISTLKRDERIYQLLLFGYSRSSDKISIAQPDGSNREFNVFSPKIISSVDDIHLCPDFEELHRRLIVIPHKSFEDFTAEEKKQYQNFDIHQDKLDIESIHWDGIEDNFFSFWNKIDNCKLYAKYRASLTKKGREKFIHGMTSSQWTISIDLIVTGLIIGAWNTPTQAINHMSDYWEFANNNIFSQLGATQEHLQQFIENEIGTQQKLNEQLSASGKGLIPLIISPQKLKSALAYHHARGELDIPPNTGDIISVMSRFGWRLTRHGWIEKR